MVLWRGEITSQKVIKLGLSPTGGVWLQTMCTMGNLTGKPLRERTRLREMTSSIQAFRHPGKKEDLGGCLVELMTTARLASVQRGSRVHRLSLDLPDLCNCVWCSFPWISISGIDIQRFDRLVDVGIGYRYRNTIPTSRNRYPICGYRFRVL